MSSEINTPQYLHIALDIAARIIRGDFKEGSKIYGRSVMASEYGVSPETIRRAMKLLDDMNVVSVIPQSGVKVISTVNAQTYVARFGQRSELHFLQRQLKDMLALHSKLSSEIADAAAAIAKLEEKPIEQTLFKSHEAIVPKGSFLSGKSLNELKFWQATGATIIAIRRETQIILSPGPYAQLFEGDGVIFVGNIASAKAVRKYLSE